ncbi:Acetyl-CoA acetyltransferase IA (Peroxisomal acetoacetyl-CoA thiolase) (Thiolase IA) [Scheffersomyces stipitis CBS 6054]|uniref:acetyl-CoA C-acetyltransferase n=1 Tax=Scheffersomyces stipitis (strain ATCC 58785 / CBS 6054 / NBRC 10063 / NRRL Y-11545) TaxID=322104 RepID=A3LPT7_PICST|nr:Acetyl-CoA acetyltransferase IA (Peroxisomal acetoacetyl-CoA thiolase) (Thiolase IA) [Scheffersomyces stipitis CBS 6054]ABN64554.1 Acetyl-CoA acetyltransferase IA (Peroxisomal acetoacetyl-CoA thiolase) (Thiolase IA) [Scheffersomyces stipitis CBS 6054]
MSVYIVASIRTPIGSFQGSLSPLSSVDLGAKAVHEALKQVPSLPASAVEEIFFGSALQANLGQNPARQVALSAGLPEAVVATSVNKVCASGLKAIISGAQTILTNTADVVVVGGSESMSNVPFYAPIRSGVRYGDASLVDGIQNDGLKDVYSQKLMGHAGEKVASDLNITRAEQDEYAIGSYAKAINAHETGKFENEITPITIKTRAGTKTVSKDEDISKYNPEKLKTMKSAFIDNGTVTAGNSPSLNDGGAALILVSEAALNKYGLKPLAKIRSWGEAARAPMDFTIAPSLAIPKTLERAGVSINDVDYFELNEAFSVVGLANSKLLDIPLEKLNVYGGAVAIGHPLGCSGARIVVTLLSVLKQEKTNSKLGVAAVCNGGGGASSILIEAL